MRKSFVLLACSPPSKFTVKFDVLFVFSFFRVWLHVEIHACCFWNRVFRVQIICFSINIAALSCYSQGSLQFACGSFACHSILPLWMHTNDKHLPTFIMLRITFKFLQNVFASSYVFHECSVCICLVVLFGASRMDGIHDGVVTYLSYIEKLTFHILQITIC